MKKTFYYSVSNGGDDSAYPIFFEDKLCADIHQELQDEGWGEDCTGSIDIETSVEGEVDCEVKLLQASSKEDYIKELEEDLAEPWCPLYKKVAIENALIKLKA
jgi:hypothetical protein